MVRGLPGWLSCGTAVLLLHTLGLDSRYMRQLVFGITVGFQILSEDARSWLSNHALRSFQYSLVILGIFLLARHLLWSSKDSSGWAGKGKVLLFPCKTTHTRLFPKRHSFDYSYLVVGIPVGWEGVSGGMVSSFSKNHPGPWFSASGKGWYHVDPDDYLDRGDGHLGLRGKLDSYLESQGVDPAKYPHAYLVTAAKFLGYHFNPVSFWYLYSADMSLGGMILEVNNTFDERRLYFLTPGQASELDEVEGTGPSSAVPTEGVSKLPIFKQQWPKDFHVSPFNSRKGSYSLLASDALRALGEGRKPIDGTITLKSNKGHGKIVARLVSDGDAIDPSSMSIMQKAAFLLSWWWVGFVTFPRIVREAGRLWFQRKLHVWYRPEPLKESIGRNADSSERKLEQAFRKYLRYLVEQCQAPVAVKYIPSGISDSGRELILSPSAKARPGETEELDFKVLTPAFYMRFVFYAHDLEALFSELRESCTIWVSRADLLPKLLFKKPAARLEARNPLDFFYFEAIRYLRRRPDKIVQPLTSNQQPAAPQTRTTAVDIRDFRMSSMDAYMLEQEDEQTKKEYRNLVLKLFVAERMALGSLLLVDATLMLLQAWTAWTLTFAWRGQMGIFGIALATIIYGYE